MITLITLIVSIVALMTVFRSLSSQNCFQVALVIGDVIGTAVNFQNAGSTHHTIAFLGVPFAENTGGEKRFGKPEAKKRWQTVFNATYKRSPCCQELTSGEDLFRASLSDTTEDCLHLNIWVPTDCMEGIQRYPVVFWVYGGGFEYGGNNYDVYDGRYISGFGNLVVVVPNYRINAFGFLNVQTQDAPGNMGLHDVILAYRWVLDHIGRFGGDRENIVLAGQSTGSIIAGLLMMSPILPSSFFSKAYLMSGSVFMKLQKNSNETALENFNKLANEANCSMTTTTETVRCLRAKTSEEVLAAHLRTKHMFSPSYFDEILPSDIKTLIKSFNASNKRLMLSTTRLDGSAYFDSKFRDVVEQELELTPTMLKDKYPSMFDNVYMLAFFGGAYNISQDDYMGWKEIFTDVLYRCVMELMGKLFDQQGATVYFQEFWPKPSFVDSSGVYASHADDVYMLFGYPFLYPLLATDIERKTSLRMIGTLAAFAKDGKLPLLEDGSQWPEYSKASGFPVVEHRHSGYSNTEPNRNCVAALSLNCDSKVSRLTPLF